MFPGDPRTRSSRPPERLNHGSFERKRTASSSYDEKQDNKRRYERDDGDNARVNIPSNRVKDDNGYSPTLVSVRSPAEGLFSRRGSHQSNEKHVPDPHSATPSSSAVPPKSDNDILKDILNDYMSHITELAKVTFQREMAKNSYRKAKEELDRGRKNLPEAPSWEERRANDARQKAYASVGDEYNALSVSLDRHKAEQETFSTAIASTITARVADNDENKQIRRQLQSTQDEVYDLRVELKESQQVARQAAQLAQTARQVAFDAQNQAQSTRNLSGRIKALEQTVEQQRTQNASKLTEVIESKAPDGDSLRKTAESMTRVHESAKELQKLRVKGNDEIENLQNVALVPPAVHGTTELDEFEKDLKTVEEKSIQNSARLEEVNGHVQTLLASTPDRSELEALREAIASLQKDHIDMKSKATDLTAKATGGIESQQPAGFDELVMEVREIQKGVKDDNIAHSRDLRADPWLNSRFSDIELTVTKYWKDVKRMDNELEEFLNSMNSMEERITHLESAVEQRRSGTHAGNAGQSELFVPDSPPREEPRGNSLTPSGENASLPRTTNDENTSESIKSLQQEIASLREQQQSHHVTVTKNIVDLQGTITDLRAISAESSEEMSKLSNGIEAKIKEQGRHMDMLREQWRTNVTQSRKTAVELDALKADSRSQIPNPAVAPSPTGPTVSPSPHIQSPSTENPQSQQTMGSLHQGLVRQRDAINSINSRLTNLNDHLSTFEAALSSHDSRLNTLNTTDLARSMLGQMQEIYPAAGDIQGGFKTLNEGFAQVKQELLNCVHYNSDFVSNYTVTTRDTQARLEAIRQTCNADRAACMAGLKRMEQRLNQTPCSPGASSPIVLPTELASLAIRIDKLTKDTSTLPSLVEQIEAMQSELTRLKDQCVTSPTDSKALALALTTKTAVDDLAEKHELTATKLDALRVNVDEIWQETIDQFGALFAKYEVMETAGQGKGNADQAAPKAAKQPMIPDDDDDDEDDSNTIGVRARGRAKRRVSSSSPESESLFA
ncbi:MAG: hypothetical protein M1833_003346 [Piccolia ochrophora]|nr:MAG: hypothetical protein M1833_003346 [Piccolia ochrophora]